MIASGLTGYMATVANLKDPVDKWRCAAAPLTVRLPLTISYAERLLCIYLLIFYLVALSVVFTRR
jgi:hypothetical protein